MTLKISFVCLVFLFVLLMGCTSPFVQEQPETGNLIVDIQSLDASARTILPIDADITASTYTFSCSGPLRSTITATTQVASSFSARSIAAGAWIITVKGNNAAGTIVAQASAAITVPAGGTAKQTIQLAPLSGTGTLALTVSWPSGTSADAAVASLTPVGGRAEDIDLTISGNQATLTVERAAGSYTLIVNLKNLGMALAPPRLEAIRLYSGLTSAGTVDFSVADLEDGGTASTASYIVGAGTYESALFLSLFF
ncbi:MAG: hypothetical protein WCQ50_15375 [Spirochaetota bacterium]